ncbi:hypothetical protein EDF66_101682 [Sphingobacterium sp. JUb20]|nr:hypothetical protein [Sphingobacterium sp. JUb21]TCR10867.1 hypothetical protein EDF66_101682 [Sphingobacterium sp. JUb20]
MHKIWSNYIQVFNILVLVCLISTIIKTFINNASASGIIYISALISIYLPPCLLLLIKITPLRLNYSFVINSLSIIFIIIISIFNFERYSLIQKFVFIGSPILFIGSYLWKLRQTINEN